MLAFHPRKTLLHGTLPPWTRSCCKTPHCHLLPAFAPRLASVWVSIWVWALLQPSPTWFPQQHTRYFQKCCYWMYFVLLPDWHVPKARTLGCFKCQKMDGYFYPPFKKKKKGVNTKTQNHLKTIPTNYAMLVGINNGSAAEERPEDVLLVVVR